MIELVKSTLKKLSKSHHGFEPIEKKNKLIFLDKGLRRQPFYAEFTEKNGGVFVIFHNICPSYAQHFIKIEGELEDDWITISLMISDDMPFEEVKKNLDDIFRLSKSSMKAIVDNDRKASLYYYGGLKVSFLGFNFFLIPRKYKKEIIKNYWAPYPIVTLANNDGIFFFMDDVYSINEPILKLDNEGFVFLEEKRPKVVKISILIDALKEIGIISDVKSEAEIFSNNVLKKLSKKKSQKAKNLARLIELFREQDNMLVMRFIAKSLAEGKLRDFTISGKVIKEFKRDARKYKGTRVISLKEDELGIKFNKEVKGKILDADGRKYIIIEIR